MTICWLRSARPGAPGLLLDGKGVADLGAGQSILQGLRHLVRRKQGLRQNGSTTNTLAHVLDETREFALAGGRRPASS